MTAWLLGWHKRIKLTIDQGDIDAALADFPILVYLSASSGRNSDDVSHIFDELLLDANRKKIAVTTSDGVTQCYVEIEKWDDANGKAWLWVKVPSVASGADTDIYLYYDKTHADNTDYVGDTNSTPAENVWPDGYFITHMKDDPDNAHIRDSSSYSSDGDKGAANQPQEVAGDKTAYAQDFNPANPDYIEIPADQTQLDFTSENFSLVARIKFDTLSDWDRIFERGAINHDGYSIQVNAAGALFFYTNQEGAHQVSYTLNGTLIIATWYTIGFSRDGTSIRVYKNGVDVTSTAAAHTNLDTCSRSAKIGINDNKISNSFDGKIEFLGVFGGVALTPAFHKAFNEGITDDLLAFGSEETLASKVLIGNTIVQIKKGSLSADQRIEERSVAGFTVIDLAGTASYQRGQPVEVYDVNNALAFGGIIDTPEKVAVAPSGGLYHPIRCTDWHHLADRRLVVASWAVPTDAGVIVTALHASYLAAEGITIGAVQTGPEIPEAIFNYVTVAEAYDILAEMAGFTWFIDEHRQLFFIDRITYSAPWDWSPATPKPAGNLASLSSGNPSYRNRQYIRGGMGLTVLQTENRTGDGTTDIFVLGYPLAKVPTIIETPPGPPAKTVGIKGIDTGKDYYWSKGDNIIYAAVAPDVADIIQFQYYGQYPLISLAMDEGARIARQAIEGGTGIVENIIYEAHDSGVSSQESARAKLTDYCRDAARFSYRTTDSGLRPGQLQIINHPLLGLNNAEMLIESITMTPYGEFITYAVTAIVGPVIGSWTRFFSMMLRRQVAAIRIGDERLLMLLRQAESLGLVEAPAMWSQAKGQYCWAPKTNGVGLREARWDFFTWG